MFVKNAVCTKESKELLLQGRLVALVYDKNDELTIKMESELEEMSKMPFKINIATVDAKNNQSVVESQNITTFPTIIFLDGGLQFKKLTEFKEKEEMIEISLGGNKDNAPVFKCKCGK